VDPIQSRDIAKHCIPCARKQKHYTELLGKNHKELAKKIEWHNTELLAEEIGKEMEILEELSQQGLIKKSFKIKQEKNALHLVLEIKEIKKNQ
jgi:hypothetical protein